MNADTALARRSGEGLVVRLNGRTPRAILIEHSYRRAGIIFRADKDIVACAAVNYWAF
jgi:hypothetical protein